MFVLFWILAGDSDAVLSRVMQNFSYWETVNTSQQVEARLDSGPSIIRFKIWPSCCFYISSAARVRCPTLFKSRGVLRTQIIELLNASNKSTHVLSGRGPTGLRDRVRNRGRLENRGCEVPKTEFQPRLNSDIYSQNYHFGLVYH